MRRLRDFFSTKTLSEDGVFVLPRKEIERIKKQLRFYQVVLALFAVGMSLWVGSLRDRIIEAESKAIIIFDNISMKKYDVSAMQEGESFYLVFNRKIERMGDNISYNILHPPKPKGDEAHAFESPP